MARRSVVIEVPWTPCQKCNPNTSTVSERTRKRYRQKGADQSVMPIRVAAQSGAAFSEPVRLDVTVYWGKFRKPWDTDNLWTAMKQLRDKLQTEGVVVNDNLIQTGTITQYRRNEHDRQEGMELTITTEAA